MMRVKLPIFTKKKKPKKTTSAETVISITDTTESAADEVLIIQKPKQTNSTELSITETTKELLVDEVLVNNPEISELSESDCAIVVSENVNIVADATTTEDPVEADESPKKQTIAEPLESDILQTASKFTKNLTIVLEDCFKMLIDNEDDDDNEDNHEDEDVVGDTSSTARDGSKKPPPSLSLDLHSTGCDNLCTFRRSKKIYAFYVSLSATAN